MNVERKPFRKFEASATLYEDGKGGFEEDAGFGTQEEETLQSFLFCKDCKNLEDNQFELMPDITDDVRIRYFNTDTSYMQHSIEEDSLRLFYYEKGKLIKQHNFAYNRIFRYGFLYSSIPDVYLFQLTYEIND